MQGKDQGRRNWSGKGAHTEGGKFGKGAHKEEEGSKEKVLEKVTQRSGPFAEH